MSVRLGGGHVSVPQGEHSAELPAGFRSPAEQLATKKEGEATVIADNVLGARTDLELRTVLNAHIKKTVIVDFGSNFCPHCKNILPHFLAASRKRPKQQFVVVNVDYMLVESQGIIHTPTFAVYKRGKKVDAFYGYNEQRLDDHLWLHGAD